MQMLSDLYPELKDHPLFLVKISQKKYVEEIQKGNLYMNNVKYFVEEERKTGKKGMGDLYDGALRLEELKEAAILQYEDENMDKIKNLIPLGGTPSLTLRPNCISLAPIFCSCMITGSMFEVLGQDGDQIVTKITFTEEQKEKMLKDFGNDALLIPFRPFVSRVYNSFKKQNIGALLGKVGYLDFSETEKERIEAFENEEDEYALAFMKSEEFKYQNEYRILITNKHSETATTINIGDLSHIAKIYTAEELLKNPTVGVVFSEKELNKIIDELKE